ncbi:hypothetical protein PsYK624_117900 [Phanerochaete sordida]|uniref:N-acetyltransferase domain-containing protein n=1 Tax=Phanerochaete sordida TaxID=48140 RepID=A0A9P3LIF2_9APHY|nr:hypothetical protein PsYK624_117900 [Phanerochaete sordida]
MRSIAHDPLNLYLYNTPDDYKYRARWQVGRKVKLFVQYCHAVYSGTAWTVNHGDSIMLLADPTLEERPLNKILSRFVTWIVRLINWYCLSAEQQKRTAELISGMQNTFEAFLGESMSHILEIDHLATAPECQHRGYATALVQLAAALADARGVQLELTSSHPANRHFYQSLGFKFLHTFYVGAENTSWAGAPVSIDLMVRDPKDIST